MVRRLLLRAKGGRRADTRPAPPLAPQKGKVWPGRGGKFVLLCDAQTYDTQPLARSGSGRHRDPRFFTEARSTRPGVSWRRTPAGGRRQAGLSTAHPASSSAPPTGGGGRFSLNRTRSKRPSSAPPGPRCRCGIGSAQLHTHSSDSNLSYTPALQWGLRTNGFRAVGFGRVSGAFRGLRARLPPRPLGKGSYLVDPASSHMLVSKIKPCMSKYKLLYTVKLRMAH
jgi:hypothetical protein